MRGPDEQTSGMFSYLSPEQRVRPDHPLRVIRRLTDEVFAALSPRFTQMYSTDYPLGPGAITAQFDYNRFDGDVTLLTLPKQNDLLLELGYLIRSLKLTPVLQFVQKDVVATSVGDEKRVSIGANYWWAGSNANIKAAFMRIEPTAPLPSQKEFTVQLQLSFF
jgi:hypothetical protein